MPRRGSKINSSLLEDNPPIGLWLRELLRELLYVLWQPCRHDDGDILQAQVGNAVAIRTAATRNVTGGSDRCTVLRPTEKFSFVSATASTGFTTCPLPQRSPLVPKAHIKSVVYLLGMRAAGLLFLGEFIRTYRFSPYPRP